MTKEIESHLKRKLNAQEVAAHKSFIKNMGREPTANEISAFFPDAEEVKAHISSFTSRIKDLSNMTDEQIIQKYGIKEVKQVPRIKHTKEELQDIRLAKQRIKQAVKGFIKDHSSFETSKTFHQTQTVTTNPYTQIGMQTNKEAKQMPKKVKVESDLDIHARGGKTEKIPRTEEQARFVQNKWNFRKGFRGEAGKAFTQKILNEKSLPDVTWVGSDWVVPKYIPKQFSDYPGGEKWGQQDLDGGTPSSRITSKGAKGSTSPKISTPRSSTSIEYNSPFTTLPSEPKVATLASKVARVTSKVASHPITKIAGRVASHPITKIAGRATEVVAATMMAKELGTDVIGIVGDIKRRVNRPSVEYDPSQYGKIIPSRSKIGLKVPLPKSINPTIPAAKPETQGQRNMRLGIAMRASAGWGKVNVVTPIAGGSSQQKTQSSIKRKPPKSKVYMPTTTPSIIPKRPEQITEDLSFLTPLSFEPRKRVSPVKPIPERAKLPEQFMSPGVSLTTLPKINRYRLLGESFTGFGKSNINRGLPINIPNTLKKIESNKPQRVKETSFNGVAGTSNWKMLYAVPTETQEDSRSRRRLESGVFPGIQDIRDKKTVLMKPADWLGEYKRGKTKPRTKSGKMAIHVNPTEKPSWADKY